MMMFKLNYMSMCNTWQALMSLFVLASKDGWVSIMYTGLDAVGVDQQVNISFYISIWQQKEDIFQNLNTFSYVVF